MSDLDEFPEIDAAAAPTSLISRKADLLLLDELRALRSRMAELAGEAAQQDEKLWADLLDGQTDGPDKLRALLDKVVLWETQAEGLAQTIVRYESHKDSLIEQAKALREMVRNGMQTLGLKAIKGANYSASIAPGKQAVRVANLDELPKQFKRVTVTANKEAIAEAIKDGTTVPGATLSNPEPSLRVTKL